MAWPFGKIKRAIVAALQATGKVPGAARQLEANIGMRCSVSRFLSPPSRCSPRVDHRWSSRCYPRLEAVVAGQGPLNAKSPVELDDVFAVTFDYAQGEGAQRAL